MDVLILIIFLEFLSNLKEFISIKVDFLNF